MEVSEHTLRASVEPTWVPALVSWDSVIRFGQCGLGESTGCCRVLSFLYTGAFCIPVLLPQSQLHSKYLDTEKEKA